MEQQSLFIPLARATKDDSRTVRAAALRGVFLTCLTFEDCASAAAPYKNNGGRDGHPVLDDWFAVDAIIKVAPKELAKQIESADFSKHEKAKILNQAIRRDHELDKHGKLTGQPSKRALLTHAKQTKKETE